jgi:hypothetical protein
MKNFSKQVFLSIVISCLAAAKLYAQPTMSAPTISGITSTSAVLGGTIAGPGITVRGTAWKTTSPVLATDNQLAEGGTGASAYTHTRSGLPAGTQIFFVAYGTNGGGMAISSESSFFTLSNAPSGQPASFTATPVSGSQINLAWASVTADGFLIYRRAGATAPNVSAITNAAAPPVILADGSTLINNATGAATSYNDNTGLSSGTQYSYTLVPFGFNGSDSQTLNYLIAGALTSTATTLMVGTSTITLMSGTTTSAIDYASFQTGGALTTGGSANSVSLGRFIINDLGGDGLPTTLTSVTLSIANFANLNQIAIFDDAGTNLGQQTVSGGSVTFSGLTTVFTSNNNSDNSGRFRIRATFLPVVTDNQQINIAITGVTSLAGGSAFVAPNAGGASTSGTNDIDVVATRLVFSPAGPLTVSRNVDFAPISVRTVDALGNLDLDRSNTVTLTRSPSSGTFTKLPSGTPNVTAGVLNYTSLILSAGGTYTLTADYATSGVANATLTVNVTGTAITPATYSTITSLCYNGNFQDLTSIVIKESNPDDFGAGNDVTFSLILPTNFIFNTAVTTAPLVAGNEISSPSALSYIGNNIVRFSYTITGTTDPVLDQITIAGLQVKYIGTVPATGNITRVGGSAMQQGNGDNDGRNHGTLTANDSSTPVSFSVATVPGEQTVNASDNQFQVTINAVRLIGSPAGGTFSGNGVSPNPTYGYVFSPSSVGVSTNAIKYTTIESTGQGCEVSVTKSFNVFLSNIQNLQQRYCKNEDPSPALSVLQADINNEFGITPTFNFYDLVYVSSVVQSNPTTIFGFTLYDETTTFSYLGTGGFAGTRFCPVFSICNTTSVSPIQGLINTFDPKLPIYSTAQNDVNLRNVRVYYRVVNSTNPSDIRISTSHQRVRLNDPPNVSFSVAKTEFCSSEDPIELFGSPQPSINTSIDRFIATGKGASSLSATGNPVKWKFDPGAVADVAAATPQTFDLTYTYQDPTTLCSASTLPVSITVNGAPLAMDNSNLAAPNINICTGKVIGTFNAKPPLTLPNTYKWYTDAPLMELKQSGSSYTPSSVDMNNIVPAITNFYVTRTINGCESPAKIVTMTVKAAPAPNFSTPTACINTPVTLNGPVNALITNWKWDFGDGRTDIGQTVTPMFPEDKSYPIILEVTSSDGCIATSLPQNLSVRPNPVAAFNTFRVCDGDFTELEAAVSNPAITQYKWEFGDTDILGADFISALPNQTDQPFASLHSGRTIGTYNKPRHRYSALVPSASTFNSYPVKLTVFTVDGCKDIATKNIKILKTISPNKSNPYFMSDLNGGDGFWSVEDLNGKSSWAFAQPVPVVKKVITSTDKMWITNPSGEYNADDDSFVNSPCFDLTGFTNPAISLDYWVNADNKDGAVLESSLNGGRTWQLIGTRVSGLEWYNTPAISSTPGQNQLQFGWSNQTNILKTGKNSITPLIAPKARFRIAFASDERDQSDGFAFKNVKIEERNRLILIENFTNEKSPKLVQNNDGFKGIPAAGVAKIQYHTSFPGTDAINLQNQADHNARAAFYGLTNNPANPVVPIGFIDGLSEGNFTSNWYISNAELRSLESSPFTIQINNPKAAPTEIAAQVSITSSENITGRKLSVFVAIVEKEIGTNTFVMRKLLPTAAGTTLPTTITKSVSINLPIMTWRVGSDIDLTKLAIVAFIQELDPSLTNSKRKDVLQSAILLAPSNLPSIISSVDDSPYSLTFYPVPANKTLEVKMGEQAKSYVPIIVYDAIGKVVTESGINEGQYTKTLDTAEWAGGVYIVQLDTDKGVVRKKVMVTH